MPSLEKILVDAIHSLNRPPDDIPDDYEILKVNILAYMWLIKYDRKGISSEPIQHIPKKSLERYIGTKHALDATIDAYFSKWIKRTDDEYTISREELLKIEDILEEFYKIKQPLPFFPDGILGYVFIRNLYKNPPRQLLRTRVITGFLELFGRQYIKAQKLVKNFVKITDLTGEWRFLMAIYPSDKALEFRSYECKTPDDPPIDTMTIAARATLTILDENEQAHNTQELIHNTLIIAPELDSVEAFLHLVAVPHVYHIRPLEFLQFFHGVYNSIYVDKYPVKDMVQRLDEIFPDRAMWHFSAKYALDILVDKQPPKIKVLEGYLIPIILPEGKAAEEINLNHIMIGFDRSTGRLKNDPEWNSPYPDKDNRQQHRLSYDKMWYGYRVINQTNTLDEEYEFITLKDLSSKLTEKEAYIARSAIMSAQQS
jgi:hypothetical protein